MSRGPTSWHYLGCALLSAVIGVSIVGFAQSPEPPRRLPAREAVRVQPRLVSAADYAYHGFTLLLPRKLPRDAQPPPNASCDEVYQWGRKHGGEDVGRGRVLLRLTAQRFAEVTIREVTVRTVASERPADGVYLYCLPDRGDGGEDAPLSCVPGYENSTSGCVTGPVFAAGRGSDVLLGHDYHVRTADQPYRTLVELPFTLAEGESYELPVTALSTRDIDASYVISVRLTVNGRRVSRTLDDGGDPFRVLWQPHGIGFHPPAYTWQEGESDRLQWDPGGG